MKYNSLQDSMKFLLKISVCLIATAWLWASCSSNDEGYDTLWTGYANVILLEEHKPGIQPNFQLVLDEGTIMNVISTHVYFPEDVVLEDDTRVAVSFLIYDEYYTADQKYYNISLLAMVEVLCKKPLYSSDHPADLGNDPINVERTWIGGKYLNMNFSILVEKDSEKKHYINLLVNEDHADADEENIYLELRHNAFGEKEELVSNGRVSFDISEFLSESRPSVNLHIQYTNYDGHLIMEGGLPYSNNLIQSPGSEAFAKPQDYERFY
ncbi:MAG: hypothetical protein LUD68_08365 [Rikenellaceae bacterium]|nr:hypothetical protein [Rikenellaceae bacterium]